MNMTRSFLATAITSVLLQMPATAAVVDDAEEVVREWADAWQSQDVPDYLSHYHSDFQPQYFDNRNAWQDDRTQKISKPAKIELMLRDVTVEDDSEEGIRLNFWLDYRSPTYSDSTLKEMLIKVDKDGELRIVREINREVHVGAAAFVAAAQSVATAAPAPAAVAAPTASSMPDSNVSVGSTPTPVPAASTEHVLAPATQPLTASQTNDTTSTGKGKQDDRKPQNYVGLHVGRHDVDDWKGRVNLGNNIAFDGQVNLDSKWEAGIVIGREYAYWRWEGEYQQGRYDATDVVLGPKAGRASGSGKYQAAMLNGYRVKQFSERVDGYAGLGIGWGKANLPQLGFNSACQCFAQADDSGFVWQWRLGIEYRVRDDHELFLQYSNLVDMPGPASSSGSPAVRYEDKDIATVSAGWRKRF